MALWIPLAMAATSLLKEKQAADATEQYNKGQAEVSRYSPWTGMQGQLRPNSPNYLGAAAKGGLQGYMLSNAMNNPDSFSWLKQQTPQAQLSQGLIGQGGRMAMNQPTQAIVGNMF